MWITQSFNIENQVLSDRRNLLICLHIEIIYTHTHIYIYIYRERERESPFDIVANMLDCNIFVIEIKLQLCITFFTWERHELPYPLPAIS